MHYDRQSAAAEIDMRIPMIVADISMETGIPEEEVTRLLIQSVERLRSRREYRDDFC